MIALLASLLLATLTLDLREGSLTYTLVHKLHEVQGVTHALEGRAQVQPDGIGRVQVRAKVATFDSGNSNRDEHMREVTHEAAHPYATVKGTLSGLAFPLKSPAEVTLHATVELNGVKQAAEIPIKLTPEGARVRAKFAVSLSLDAFQIDRPELLFVKVDDRVLLSGELLFEEAK